MKSDQKQRKTGNLKLISIIAAILLWFFVTNQGQLTARNAVETDVNYTKLADNLMVSGPDTVTVKLWGTFRETDSVEAFVDLGGLVPGSYDLPVTLRQSNRALFSSVEPNRVKVVIREIKENSIIIEARNTAALPQGFEMLDIFTVPGRCSVQGEQSEVSKVTTVIAPLSLTGSTEIQSATVTLQALDQNGNIIAGVRLVPEKAVVYAAVSQTMVSKKAAIKPVYKGSLPEGYERGQVIIEPAEAFLIGAEAKSGNISEITTEEIDLNDKTSSFTIEAKLTLKEGIKIYPAQAVIYIEINQVTEQDDNINE